MCDLALNVHKHLITAHVHVLRNMCMRVYVIMKIFLYIRVHAFCTFDIHWFTYHNIHLTSNNVY